MLQRDNMIESNTINTEPVIKIIGVGGGGNNAVSSMIDKNFKNVEFYLVNTEKGILERADSKCKTLQIGKELTNGLGAGANPEIGEKSAEESIQDINRMLEGADLVFLTAGMRRRNRNRSNSCNCKTSKR